MTVGRGKWEGSISFLKPKGDKIENNAGVEEYDKEVEDFRKGKISQRRERFLQPAVE